MNKKKIVAIALTVVCAIGCAFALAACGEKPDTVDVTSIVLDKATLSMQIGEEQTLTATVKPDDATQKTVSWTSSNTAVATVTNGKVTAVAAGTATITAKAGEKTATCSVNVSASTDPLAGKKYVIAKVESEQMSDAEKEEYIQTHSTAVYAFGTDGTVVETVASIMAGMPNIKSTATYTIEGSIVTLTITKVEYNGIEQDLSKFPNRVTTLTFDGTYLIQDTTTPGSEAGVTLTLKAYYIAQQEEV